MKPSTLITVAITLAFFLLGAPFAAIGFLVAAAVVSHVMS